MPITEPTADKPEFYRVLCIFEHAHDQTAYLDRVGRVVTIDQHQPQPTRRDRFRLAFGSETCDFDRWQLERVEGERKA